MNPYSTAWQRYRQLRAGSLLFLLGFVPYLWLLFWLNQHYPADFYGILVLPYLVLWIAILVRFLQFRCPRCRDAFSLHWWQRLFAQDRQCVHCYLQKFGGD